MKFVSDSPIIQTGPPSHPNLNESLSNKTGDKGSTSSCHMKELSVVLYGLGRVASMLMPENMSNPHDTHTAIGVAGRTELERGTIQRKL